MSYIMLKSDKDVADLTETVQTALTIDKSLGLLVSGMPLVVSKLEKTTGADVFVRLNMAAPTPVTEISYSSPASSTGAVWSSYPIAINVFSLYTVYQFDPKFYGAQKFYVGDTIRYKTQGGAAVGLVNAVFIDTDNNLYYQVNGELYTIAETPDGVTVNSNISGMVVKQPVADPEEDFHTIDVSDYKDTVYVLY